MRSHLDRLVRRPPRPSASFDVGLQHERTSLAWERTGISVMVAATLLSRYAAEDGVWLVAGVAFAFAAVGGLILLWSGVHYDDLHQTLRDGSAVDHHRLIKAVGLVATGITAGGLVLTMWLAATP